MLKNCLLQTTMSGCEEGKQVYEGRKPKWPNCHWASTGMAPSQPHCGTFQSLNSKAIFFMFMVTNCHFKCYCLYCASPLFFFVLLEPSCWEPQTESILVDINKILQLLRKPLMVLFSHLVVQQEDILAQCFTLFMFHQQSNCKSAFQLSRNSEWQWLWQSQSRKL